MRNLWSPLRAREGLNATVLSYNFVHRDLREGVAKDTVVDRPASASNRGMKPGPTEWGGAVKLRIEIPARAKTGMDAVHQPAANLVPKSIAFKDNGVVIVERLCKVHGMSQRAHEFLEGIDRMLKHAQTPPYLPGRQPCLHRCLFGLDVSLKGPKFGGAAVWQAVYVKSGRFGVVDNVEQNMHLSIDSIGQMCIEQGILCSILVPEVHDYVRGAGLAAQFQ